MPDQARSETGTLVLMSGARPCRCGSDYRSERIHPPSTAMLCAVM